MDRQAVMQSAEQRLDPKWEKAVEYFRSRKGVIFYAHDPLFENHSHSQQSLPLLLAANGIPTVWFDGMRIKRHKIVIPSRAKGPLTIKALPSLPGRRFRLINQINCAFQNWYLRRLMKQMGGNPVIWVHSGMDGELAKRLPYIDVFAYFDDLYRQDTHSAVLEKARVVTVQNEYALKITKANPKYLTLLPPSGFDETEIDDDAKPAALPPGFPERRMGFIGSLFDAYFDFDRFELMVRQLPEWGFVLAGRSDSDGEARLHQLKKYPNVVVLPTIPRRQIGSYWKLIDVCLLLYRPQKNQLGSFASKALEALYFGCSLAGKLEPKTQMLARHFPMVDQDKDLAHAAITAHHIGKHKREELLQVLLVEMSPKNYFAEVVDHLRQQITK